MTIWQRGAAALAILSILSACGAATDLVESAPTEPTDATSSTPSPSEPTAPSPTTPTETTPTTPAMAEPKVGECRRTNPVASALGGSLEQRKPVPCGETHNAQTYFVGYMNESAQAAARSGDAGRLRAMVSGICARQLTRWLGGSGADVALSVFDFIVGAPKPDEVGPGVRWFSCDAYAIRAMNGLKLSALPRTTKGLLASGQAAQWAQCNRGGFGSGNSSIVVCTRSHAYRAVAAVHMGDLDAKFPGSNRLETRLESDCAGQVRDYLDTSAGFNYGVTWPNREQWNSGDRWGICYAQTSS